MPRPTVIEAVFWYSSAVTDVEPLVEMIRIGMSHAGTVTRLPEVRRTGSRTMMRARSLNDGFFLASVTGTRGLSLMATKYGATRASKSESKLGVGPLDGSLNRAEMAMSSLSHLASVCGSRI